MKKFFLTICLASLAMHACDDADDSAGRNYGSLKIVSSVSGEVNLKEITRATPTTDFSGYTLKLVGPTTFSGKLPAGGIVDNLPEGEYHVTLSSHSAVPTPAFDMQYYTGMVSAEITAGESTPVDITLYQGNAGVYFVYDASLAEAGYDNLIPTLRHSEGTLTYSGSNREATGYFPEGQLNLSLTNNGVAVTLNGLSAQAFTVLPKDLVEITLGIGVTPMGSMSITATVVEVTDPTRTLSFEVGDDADAFPILSIDELVGTWDVTGYIYKGDINPEIEVDNRQFIITKASDFQILISGWYEGITFEPEERGVYHDAVYASVNLQTGRLTIPFQIFTGGMGFWYNDTVTLYFTAFNDPTGLWWGNSLSNISIKKDSQKYTINLSENSQKVEIAEGVPTYGTVVPMIPINASIMYYPIFLTETVLTKQITR